MKYLLEQLMPNVQCFLDVDHLSAVESQMTQSKRRVQESQKQSKEDGIAVLTKHVANSHVLILFLTDEIFDRFWVLTEIKAAIDNNVDICLVRETDARHGALTIGELRADCPEELRAAVFEKPAIDWFRDVHHKTVSILQLAQRIVVADDVRRWRDETPNLCLHSAISNMKFGDPPLVDKYHCYVTRSKEFVAMRKMLQAKGIKLDMVPAPSEPANFREELILNSTIIVAMLTETAMKNPDVQHDLKFALNHNKPVIVVHVCGSDNHNFGTITACCPQQLQSLGLFKDLAIPWYAGDGGFHIDNYEEHRVVAVHRIWHKVAQLCKPGADSRYTSEPPSILNALTAPAVKSNAVVPFKEASSNPTARSAVEIPPGVYLPQTEK